MRRRATAPWDWEGRHDDLGGVISTISSLLEAIGHYEILKVRGPYKSGGYKIIAENTYNLGLVKRELNK